MAHLSISKNDKDGRSALPARFSNFPLFGAQKIVALLAYEEMMVRNVLIVLLQEEGYLVLAASDGQEALDLSRMYPGSIDLVVTDVNMPRLACTDLCSLLIKERPGIKVLVMTGTDKAEMAFTNFSSPFLPRPFDAEILKATVRRILNAPQHNAPYVYMAFVGSPGLNYTHASLPSRAANTRRHAIAVRHGAFEPHQSVGGAPIRRVPISV